MSTQAGDETPSCKRTRSISSRSDNPFVRVGISKIQEESGVIVDDSMQVIVKANPVDDHDPVGRGKRVKKIFISNNQHATPAWFAARSNRGQKHIYKSSFTNVNVQVGPPRDETIETDTSYQLQSLVSHSGGLGAITERFGERLTGPSHNFRSTFAKSWSSGSRYTGEFSSAANLLHPNFHILDLQDAR